MMLALLACSGSTVPAGPPDPTAGAEVYATYCATCHQPDGSGTAPAGVRLAAPFTGPESRLARTDAELLESIRSGRSGEIGTMPPWRGVLTDQQQRDVLAYLRQRFGAGAPP